MLFVGPLLTTWVYRGHALDHIEITSPIASQDDCTSNVPSHATQRRRSGRLHNRHIARFFTTERVVVGWMIANTTGPWIDPSSVQYNRIPHVNSWPAYCPVAVPSDPLPTFLKP
jgi:hypothetical protein